MWIPIYTFWSYLVRFFLEWEMSETKVIEKIKTHIGCSIYFRFENPVFYVITWKNMAKPGRPPLTLWRMRMACWVPKVTNTHSEYVIIIAFALQQAPHCYVIRTLLALFFDYPSNFSPAYEFSCCISLVFTVHFFKCRLVRWEQLTALLVTVAVMRTESPSSHCAVECSTSTCQGWASSSLRSAPCSICTCH